MALDFETMLDDKLVMLRSIYGKEAMLLLAMSLRLHTEDYELLLADVTDARATGQQCDKKIDFLHINPRLGIIVLAQDYQAEDVSKPNAPDSKAQELNTAIAWLFHSEINDIPNDIIKIKAIEARDLLSAGQINSVEFYYVHNLASTPSVQIEITTTRNLLESSLSKYAVLDGTPIRVLVEEYSRDTLLSDFRSQYSGLLVEESVTLRREGELRFQGPEWQAVGCCVFADDIINIVELYRDKLFSPNVRDYMGRKNASRNINSRIQDTAIANPLHFPIFNNGITILTNQFKLNEDSTITLNGIGIINGAQTCGSLAEARSRITDANKIRIMARIVECPSTTILRDIVLYNNSQNPIKSWELRANDAVHTRLECEFRSLGYVYSRRRGEKSRPRENILIERLGPRIWAFYGSPAGAYRDPYRLFEDEGTYRGIYNNNTNVHNLLFVHLLSDVITELRKQYRNVNETEEDVESIRNLKIRSKLFEYGPFEFAFLYLVARAIQIIIGSTGKTDRTRIRLKEAYELYFENQGKPIVERLIKSVLSIITAVVKNDSPQDWFCNSDTIEKAEASFSSHYTAMMEASGGEIFDPIRSAMILVQ